MRLFYINCQSVRNKIEQFQLLTSGGGYQVLCLCETWLTEAESAEFNVPGYVTAATYCRREARGGGTAILLDPLLECKVPNEINSLSVERVVEMSCIYIGALDIYIICLYRPPGSDFTLFLSRVAQAVDAVGHQRNIIIFGDFNVQFGSNHFNAVTLCDMLESYGMRQMVSDATHQGNCIDNVFVNFQLDSAQVDIVDPLISDHSGLLLEISLIDTVVKNKQVNSVVQ